MGKRKGTRSAPISVNGDENIYDGIKYNNKNNISEEPTKKRKTNKTNM